MVSDEEVTQFLFQRKRNFSSTALCFDRALSEILVVIAGDRAGNRKEPDYLFGEIFHLLPKVEREDPEKLERGCTIQVKKRFWDS